MRFTRSVTFTNFSKKRHKKSPKDTVKCAKKCKKQLKIELLSRRKNSLFFHANFTFFEKRRLHLGAKIREKGQKKAKATPLLGPFYNIFKVCF